MTSCCCCCCCCCCYHQLVWRSVKPRYLGSFHVLYSPSHHYVTLPCPHGPTFRLQCTSNLPCQGQGGGDVRTVRVYLPAVRARPDVLDLHEHRPAKLQRLRAAGVRVSFPSVESQDSRYLFVALKRPPVLAFTAATGVVASRFIEFWLFRKVWCALVCCAVPHCCVANIVFACLRVSASPRREKGADGGVHCALRRLLGAAGVRRCARHTGRGEHGALCCTGPFRSEVNGSVVNQVSLSWSRATRLIFLCSWTRSLVPILLLQCWISTEMLRQKEVLGRETGWFIM